MENMIGKIDVFNTLYEVIDFRYLLNNVFTHNITDTLNFENIDITNLLLNNSESNINNINDINNIDNIKNKYNENGDTILHYITHYYIKYGDNNYFVKSKYLLENFIDIHKKNIYGHTILYSICKYNNINIKLIEFILENGGNPNLKINNEPFTCPFSYICIKFLNIKKKNKHQIKLYLDIIKLMIKYGADIYQKITIKKIVGLKEEIGSFSPYIIQNKEIKIIDLFDEIKSEYTKIIIDCFRDYTFNKRLNLLLLIEGLNNNCNCKLPKILGNEYFIKELCSFI